MKASHTPFSHVVTGFMLLVLSKSNDLSPYNSVYNSPKPSISLLSCQCLSGSNQQNSFSRQSDHLSSLLPTASSLPCSQGSLETWIRFTLVLYNLWQLPVTLRLKPELAGSSWVGTSSCRVTCSTYLCPHIWPAPSLSPCPDCSVVGVLFPQSSSRLCPYH